MAMTSAGEAGWAAPSCGAASTGPGRPVAGGVLTEQERRGLELLAAGLTSPAAADRLNVSARTLRRRIDTVCRKFGVATRIEATAEAARRGLI